jgi:predicted component of type VI protein secretion system
MISPLSRKFLNKNLTTGRLISARVHLAKRRLNNLGVVSPKDAIQGVFDSLAQIMAMIYLAHHVNRIPLGR